MVFFVCGGGRGGARVCVCVLMLRPCDPKNNFTCVCVCVCVCGYAVAMWSTRQLHACVCVCVCVCVSVCVFVCACACVCVCHCVCVSLSTSVKHTQIQTHTHMYAFIPDYILKYKYRVMDIGWLHLVSSFKLCVSFAEYSNFCRALLQKRPIIWRSLLIIATPLQLFKWSHVFFGVAALVGVGWRVRTFVCVY